MEKNMITAPSHYTIGGIEVKDILRAKLSDAEYRGYIKGNIMKYLFRAEHKGNPKQDYRKAAEYMKMLMDTLQGTQS